LKRLALGGAWLLIASLAACGGGGGSTQSSSVAASSVGQAPVNRLAKRPKPKIPPGPPPSHLAVRDIKQGSGPAIPRKGGVRIRTNYVALSYRTHKPLEVRWQQGGGFNIGFGPGIEIKGWEKGLVGMRAGGRRELRVPSNMAYGEGAILYVIDLLGVEFPPFG
jgi:peptidylprolyl isomerase